VFTLEKSIDNIIISLERRFKDKGLALIVEEASY
jgi:hypothetical protein